MKDLLILPNEMVDELLAADHIVISTRVFGAPDIGRCATIF